jgi:GTPase SAR1 family protein
MLLLRYCLLIYNTCYSLSTDVSSNPVVQPPMETCERGICSMKRYYQCLRMEDGSSKKGRKYIGFKMKKYNTTNKAIKREESLTTVSETTDSTGKIAFEQIAHMEEETLLDSASVKEHVVVEDDPLDVSALDSGAFSEILERHLDEVVTVNDTLKVIFVGMAMVGKTSMIKRLIEGRNAVIPTHDERTVGVDIYEWNPKRDARFQDLDSRIIIQDEELANICGDVDVKFSVWDFAGQHVYHATHELFFSSRALYVLVWDMGATNRETLKRKPVSQSDETGAFKLTYDSSDDEEEEVEAHQENFTLEEEGRRADRALEHDIDEKVQFWVDCIQSSAPGAAILPVASFSDFFENDGGDAEAKRRCLMLKQRLQKHEKRRIQGIRERLKDHVDHNRANDVAAVRLRKLLCDYTRPKLLFGDDDNPVVQVSGTQYTGFRELTEKIIDISTGRSHGQWRFPIFHGHIGARIPRMRVEVREEVRTMRDRFKVVEWGYFINQLADRGLTNSEDISDALHFLTSIGELSYFGGVMLDNKLANPFVDDKVSSSMLLYLNRASVERRALVLPFDCSYRRDELAALCLHSTRKQ